ncbi:MAG: UDP-glucose 4-epimerase GalE [Aquidulcibacter sp.]|nr:UDP-glucose 4-epimerase GalE [Aquidulcibacter sp.]
MRVLVVGGAGYIGSHACKALHKAGHQPIVVDSLVYGHKQAVKWGPLEVGDISDGNWLDSVFARYNPEVVMHFAAFAYVGESVTDPAKYYHNNVSGTQSLLDAMRRNHVWTLIFSSTCATYGEVTKLPIEEDTPQVPINPYGYTKLIVERMMADYQRAYGLAWVALRYFNAAGADPEGEIGESHDPETHAIPLAIAAALRSGDGFKVFGSDYETPDGSALRDYIHVSDLADAHVKAMDYLLGGGAPTAFNLGTGTPTSVFEIINAVSRVTGSNLPHDLVPRRAGDPPALYAAANKAKALLGWEPTRSDIDTIVRTAVNWHRQPAY